MKNYDNLGWVAGLMILIVFIGGIVGWILNIVSIAHSDFGHLTGLLILRIVRIFVAPIGAILGYC